MWLFQYPPRTALAVGLGMAQIGEFAFVLLSAASQHGLLAYQVYMLLMGAPRLAPDDRCTWEGCACPRSLLPREAFIRAVPLSAAPLRLRTWPGVAHTGNQGAAWCAVMVMWAGAQE